MPLKTTPKRASKKTKRKILSENIATERRAGKPPKQAVAIGFAKQREDLNKKRKVRKKRRSK